MTDEPIVKAIAARDGDGPVEWILHHPRRMADDLQGICTAVDIFLLENPGRRVTFTVENYR